MYSVNLAQDNEDDDDSVDDNDNDILDEELEFALYSQIHFEQNEFLEQAVPVESYSKNGFDYCITSHEVTASLSPHRTNFAGIDEDVKQMCDDEVELSNPTSYSSVNVRKREINANTCTRKVKKPKLDPKQSVKLTKRCLLGGKSNVSDVIDLSKEEVVDLTDDIIDLTQNGKSPKKSTKQKGKRKDKNKNYLCITKNSRSQKLSPVHEIVDSGTDSSSCDGEDQSDAPDSDVAAPVDQSDSSDSSSESDDGLTVFMDDAMEVHETEDLQMNLDKGQQRLLDQHRRKNDSNENDKWWLLDRDKHGLEEVYTRNRYYTGNNSMRCYNCRELGHSEKSCPKPQKPQICILCGTEGHHQYSCPQSICYNCNAPGHDAKACTERRRQPHAICKRCEMAGHVSFQCTDWWRQYHVTVTPVLKIIKQKPNPRKYCSNCAKKGHWEYECHHPRMDSYHQPSCPFISVYKEWVSDTKAHKIKAKLDYNMSIGKTPRMLKNEQNRKSKQKRKTEKSKRKKAELRRMEKQTMNAETSDLFGITQKVKRKNRKKQ